MKNYFEILNNTPLEQVFKEAIKAVGNVDGRPNKWNIENHGDFQISDNKWYHFHANKGGLGAISLMTYYLNLVSYKDEKGIQQEVYETLKSLNSKLILKDTLETDLNQHSISSQPKI